MLLDIVHLLYLVLLVLVIGNVLMAYFPQWRYHPLGDLIYRLSEPLLEPIRRLRPPIQTGNGARLDLSAAICLLIAYIIVEIIDRRYGARMH